MMSSHHGNKGRAFAIRAIAAYTTGETAEQFAEREVRHMMCSYCRDGWPLKDGQHGLLGVVVPCEAEGSTS